MYIYMCVCVIITESLLLYSRDWHIENQLYFNKKCKKNSGLSFCHLPPTVLTKFNAQKFQNWRCDDYIAKAAF